jgi:microcystin-dependent protein
VAGLLILIFFLVPIFKASLIPQTSFDEVFEVNLGNSDHGFGKDQPKLPGEPAQQQQVAYNLPKPVKTVNDDAKDIETTEKNKNAPEITKPTVTKPNATKINTDNKTVKVVSKPQQTVVVAPPKPKAILGRTTGGNDNGGNGADSYQKGANEGISTGPGDQGRLGGTPDGKNYTGPVKNFGVKVLQISNQSFEDEFNENAKVAMEIVADERGRILSASYTPRGSTTSNRKLIDIAERRAFELKLGTSDGGQKGTVIFNFKLRG